LLNHAIKLVGSIEKVEENTSQRKKKKKIGPISFDSQIVGQAGDRSQFK
jgi:hypothetical protein